jgi:hypothetical protein
METESSLPHYNSPPSVPPINQINPVHALHPPTWRSVLILPSHLLLGLPTGSIAYVVPRDQSNSEVFVKGSYHGKLLRWRNVRTSPKNKLEEHPLSSVCDCLFNTFAPTLHIESPSSISNQTTPHRAPLSTLNTVDIWGPIGPHSVHSTL